MPDRENSINDTLMAVENMARNKATEARGNKARCSWYKMVRSHEVVSQLRNYLSKSNEVFKLGVT